MSLDYLITRVANSLGRATVWLYEYADERKRRRLGLPKAWRCRECGAPTPEPSEPSIVTFVI